MSAGAGSLAGWRWPGALAHRVISVRAAALTVVLGAATAMAVSYAPVPQTLLLGGVLGLIVALVVVASPALSAVMLGVSIPEIQDVTGGHLGVHVAASDVVLVLIGARVLAEGTARQRFPALSALRSVRAPVLQYGWMIALVLVFHLGLGSSLKSMQRLELFALPLVVGAYVALRGKHMLVLRAYVLACTLLAVVWPILNSHGLAGQFQKNPTGGFIASAILLLMAVRPLRRLLWCAPLLLLGVGLTASRGAVLALAVGIVVIFAMQGAAGAWRSQIARILVVVVTGVVVYLFLPASITTRLTNYSAGVQSRSSYALEIREQYYQAAEKLISQHPWTGVGVGQYSTGSVPDGDFTTDPHNVILLEAAEGGYLFAASFIMLIGGLAFALWRMRRLELAVAAAAVLLATFAHGLVDVYWVRGTPILGFLLIGMVCGLAARQRAAA